MDSKSTSKEELSFDDVYVLHDPLANQPLRLDPPDEVSKETLVGLFRSEMRLSKPLELRASMGGRAMDILWSTCIPVMAISSRVVALFREHGFTGWSTYPVRVFGRKGEPIEGYHGFAVTGRVGYRVFELSQFVINPPNAYRPQHQICPRPVLRPLRLGRQRYLSYARSGFNIYPRAGEAGVE